MKHESIKKIGIVGAGVMGHGIVQVVARSGYEVLLVDISEEILKKALELIESGPFGLRRLVEKGKMSEEELKACMSRIKISTSYNDFKDCDFIIEAIPEIVELKKKVFSQLDKICKPEAIFATNTSGIMVSELASAVERKDKFIGMHWFNPAPVMRLIEIVRGPLTSDETFEITVELSKKFGKIPIEAKDGPGFFTTRFINSWLAEAIRLFEIGIAGIKEIDDMCKLAFGFPMGPFELMDLIGLDTVYHIAEYIYNETKDEHYSPPITLKKLVLSGYLGKKPNSRGGWYDYYKIKK
ncbi:MAG: 3-hydroxyacyl-CoA dehydrogenase NAD-binding domain-containing protein [Archaeoglobaceae archaeon]|nr:3-hydroxyacyl-CoA dehydrogenase NAD-binding domain-containing protein [Archaeoglobaceae archaeon]MCX8151693.1 3-hydroxyacyl-CoA dehydrogenase NAD-binding domain-containing protein [Archaeoglobaceae archaeon]MDW8013029.1 3-hydroxyacyl-CoA dehydrogenase NAD-binding domain-containing protein [Archaeoglobaceae archaeon]